MKKTTLTIYHGSTRIIKKPEYGQGRPYNDYGRGFYCTEHPELAGEWACGADTDGYINQYSIDCKGLKVYDFKTAEYGALNWLAVLMIHRIVDLNVPVMEAAREYLIDRYSVNLSGYDIIRGYRADDSYFSFVRAFLSNSISLSQLTEAMQLGQLGEQIMIRSSKAFDRIRFIGDEKAAREEYYPKRAKRDDEAKKRFSDITGNYDFSGVYVSQIISGEIGAEDERLRKALFI